MLVNVRFEKTLNEAIAAGGETEGALVLVDKDGACCVVARGLDQHVEQYCARHDGVEAMTMEEARARGL